MDQNARRWRNKNSNVKTHLSERFVASLARFARHQISNHSISHAHRWTHVRVLLLCARVRSYALPARTALDTRAIVKEKMRTMRNDCSPVPMKITNAFMSVKRKMVSSRCSWFFWKKTPKASVEARLDYCRNLTYEEDNEEEEEWKENDIEDETDRMKLSRTKDRTKRGQPLCRKRNEENCAGSFGWLTDSDGWHEKQCEERAHLLPPSSAIRASYVCFARATWIDICAPGGRVHDHFATTDARWTNQNNNEKFRWLLYWLKRRKYSSQWIMVCGMNG